MGPLTWAPRAVLIGALAMCLSTTGCATHIAGTAERDAASSATAPPSTAPSSAAAPTNSTLDPRPTDPAGTGQPTPPTGVQQSCLELAAIAQQFNTHILQKWQSGEVTAKDVAAVFSAANAAKIPADYRDDWADLKTISAQLVGKRPTDVASLLPRFEAAIEKLTNTLTDECGQG